MKRVNKNNRKKAFWGALVGAGISAATNLISSHANAVHQENIARMQYEQQQKLLERQDIQNEYNQKLQNQIAEQENDSIYDELRLKNYKYGGKVVKRKKAEFGLNDFGSIGSSLIGAVGTLGSNMINMNAQNNLANYQMKLAEDKFNSEVNKWNSANNENFAKNMRAYLNGEETIPQFNNRYKSLFRNKRMYLG